HAPGMARLTSPPVTGETDAIAGRGGGTLAPRTPPFWFSFAPPALTCSNNASRRDQWGAGAARSLSLQGGIGMASPGIMESIELQEEHLEALVQRRLGGR